MSGWQSFESAPKDGNAFLVCTYGPEIDIAWWDAKRGGFYDYHFKQKVGPWCATHWMPLPSPPVITDPTGKQPQGDNTPDGVTFKDGGGGYIR